ncbi:hypothetical protein [Niabella aurantiaca]|uniref:hypothetical protein n=1 Tax=Niabella aurantiaca TaxID=379900 RepID=UPI00036698F0|nr:hypothetical protein [Niabella aurantiaca]
MKEKIVAAIKAKFPALNLRKTRLDAIAAKLEARVKDETEIDAAVTDFDSLFPFADIAKQDDKIAELENKLKAPPKADPAPTPTPEDPKPAPDPKPNPGEEAPAWFKDYAAKNDQRFDSLLKEKQTNTRKSGYEALFADVKDDKMKANKLEHFDRLAFKDDEDYNSFIEKEKEYLTQHNQEVLKTGGLMKGSQPTSGKVPDAELDAVVDTFKI